MKKLQSMLAFLLVALPAMLVAQDSRFSLSSQFPKQGEKLTITFNPAGTEMENAEAIEALVYWVDKKDLHVDEVTMKKSGNVFSAEFTLDKSAAGAAVTFLSGDKKETNQKKGYIINVYDDKQQPVQFANRAMYSIYTDLSYTIGIDPNLELAFNHIEKEYNGNPGSKVELYNMYFSALSRLKKQNLNEIISAEIEKMEATGKLTEADYPGLVRWYGQIKQPEKADALMAKMKAEFPNGKWAKNEKFKTITAEKNAAKREEMAQAYIKENSSDSSSKSYLEWQVALAYAGEKNLAKFNTYIKNLNPRDYHPLFNNEAWAWVDKGDNLAAAKAISYRAVDYAKKTMEDPNLPKPAHLTVKQWNDNRKFTYSMYADTYAFILYKLKDYKTGYIYAKDAAQIRKMKDAEYNERYALLLEKVAKPAQIKKELEPLVKDGAAGNETREILKRSFTALNKSDKGLDAYMAGLDAANIEKLKETLKKKMISKDAPAFRLLNLQGAEVDFASLKGKVVILDFWATWCGPCIASFPSMQKMVEKYKDNKDVVFLFIDTWENVPNREKLVQQFIDKNKYTFNVLYDKQKEPGTNDFVMVKDYEVEGIPTKFIVDTNGQIRFKSVGWSGNEFAFMQELQLMIDMAGQGSGTGENNKKGFK